MTRRSLTRAEQETIIVRSADDSHWTVSSTDPAMIRKLNKLFPDQDSKELNPYESQWSLPRNAVSFRRPTVLSKEEKERRTKVLAQHRTKQADSGPDS